MLISLQRSEGAPGGINKTRDRRRRGEKMMAEGTESKILSVFVLLMNVQNVGMKAKIFGPQMQTTENQFV